MCAMVSPSSVPLIEWRGYTALGAIPQSQFLFFADLPTITLPPTFIWSLRVGILFGDLIDNFPVSGWKLWVSLVVLLIVIVGIFRYFFLIRVPLWILMHTLYRLRVRGIENLPATGPALLVATHISYIDPLQILVSQKRKIRFFMWAPYTRLWGIGLFARMADVIPIQGTGGPRAIIKSLRIASEALANGEVVCIFAEGGVTRTGFLLPFQRGFEQILKHAPAPIIPICIDHVWGSIFSHQGGKFFWKWPKALP